VKVELDEGKEEDEDKKVGEEEKEEPDVWKEDVEIDLDNPDV
jgi:hypothetical protein